MVVGPLRATVPQRAVTEEHEEDARGTDRAENASVEAAMPKKIKAKIGKQRRIMMILYKERSPTTREIEKIRTRSSEEGE
jgi:hypothetical protein